MHKNQLWQIIRCVVAVSCFLLAGCSSVPDRMSSSTDDIIPEIVREMPIITADDTSIEDEIVDVTVENNDEA